VPAKPHVLALVSIIQVVLIFAIAYLILIGQNRAAVTPPPSCPFDALFLSWISLPRSAAGQTPRMGVAEVVGQVERQ
jgi:hypothetical protein